MTKLETLYQSINGLKELGLSLNPEIINEVNILEEELIKNEVIPRLSESIEPIITKIQRPLVLVIDYVPNEKLSVRMTRKRVITDEVETKEYPLVIKENLSDYPTQDSERKREFTEKSPKTGLIVKFPNGKVVNNRFAYETFIETIELIGVEKVKKLNLQILNHDLISKEESIYAQHKTKEGYLIITHTSTKSKKQILERISKEYNLKLEIEIRD
ncbi:hypothetical protein SDC9_39498 [bioreactor metagenome]|uniref:Uncharacterized protein n=1 Tax=bioreactor metagenome TaxID=1076179 RepID=A0A644VS70_9ZZZZ